MRRLMRPGHPERILISLSLLALLILLPISCGSARRVTPAAPVTEVATTPGTERGLFIFQRHCYRCHPNGEPGIGPALNNKSLPGFMIKFQVRNGMGAMPSFPEHVISDDQLTQLVAYLSALRKHKPE